MYVRHCNTNTTYPTVFTSDSTLTHCNNDSRSSSPLSKHTPIFQVFVPREHRAEHGVHRKLAQQRTRSLSLRSLPLYLLSFGGTGLTALFQLAKVCPVGKFHRIIMLNGQRKNPKSACTATFIAKLSDTISLDVSGKLKISSRMVNCIMRKHTY